MDNLKDLFTIMDLNKLLSMYTTPMLTGIRNITLDLIIIATFLTAIDFVISCYKNIDNITGVIDLFWNKLLKFFLICISINSAENILKFSLNFFLEIGIAFGGNKSFLDGNGIFNFNQIWGYFGEIIGTVTQISAKFTGASSIFYGLILLGVVILCAVVLMAVFTSILLLYVVGVFMFITLPLNVFTPLTELSKSIIKMFIISGLKISIYLVLLNTSVIVLQNYAEELENIGISQSKNDVSAMLFFVVLLGMICAVFFSMETIALYVLMGSGTGLSFVRLGNVASQGINSAVSTGLTVAGIFVGGSGFAKLGIDAGVKGSKVARDTVKSFSNVARKSASAVNKGISKATDSEETPKPRSSGIDTLKKAKSVFQKGKGKK